jgi:hypothetical protein
MWLNTTSACQHTKIHSNVEYLRCCRTQLWLGACFVASVAYEYITCSSDFPFLDIIVLLFSRLQCVSSFCFIASLFSLLHDLLPSVFLNLTSPSLSFPIVCRPAEATKRSRRIMPSSVVSPDQKRLAAHRQKQPANHGHGEEPIPCQSRAAPHREQPTTTYGSPPRTAHLRLRGPSRPC